MNLLRSLVIIIAAVTFTSIAQAVPTTFTVENVAFDDGGTLTGTFSFDPENTSFFAVNLTSSYGSGQFPGTNHVLIISSVHTGIGGESALTAFRVRDATGTFDLFLRFVTPLYSGNSESDIIIDPSRSFELAVSEPTYITRNVVAGRVVAENADFVLYVSNRSDGTIYRIDASGDTVPFATGLGQPHEIVIDDVGNLLVADPGIDPIDRIHQITPDGDILDYFVFDDARDNPEGLALRSDGTLFVSGTIELGNAPPNNFAPNALVAISPSRVATDFASVGPQENLSVAINADDVLFVTDAADNGSIWRVLPTGESSLLVSSLGDLPRAVEVGPDGSLFVAFEGLGQILKIRLTDDLAVAGIEVYAVISRPLSLAIDRFGRLFVGQFDRVSMIDLDGSITEIAGGFNIVHGIAVQLVESAPLRVDIDIKPGGDLNSINLRSKGKIPVAVLYTETFDATQVDWQTVLFGPGGATESHARGHVKDVDGDGDMDLLLHFNTQDTGIQCGDTGATLTGETFDGQAITGTDAIRTVGCN